MYRWLGIQVVYASSLCLWEPTTIQQVQWVTHIHHKWIIPARCHQCFLERSLWGFSSQTEQQTTLSSILGQEKIPNCYDAITTSPVEYINSHIKHRTKASSLNNFSCSFNDDNRWYVQIHLYELVFCCYIVSVCICVLTYTHLYNVDIIYAQVLIIEYLT